MGESDFDGAAAYDGIVRELYSAGLILYGMASRLGPGPTADRLLEATARMDEAIKRLGVLVLALDDQPATGTGKFAARLFDTLWTAAPELDGSPATRLTGPVGDLPEDLVDDLLAVTRQALSCLAGHAHAGAVEVDVTVAEGGVCLRVSAHRVGPDGHLGDVDTGGRVRGAQLVAERHPPGGLRLTWAVPG